MQEEIEVTFYAEKRADGWYVRMSSEGIPERWEGPMRSREVAVKTFELFCAQNFNKLDPNEDTSPIIVVRKAPAIELFINILTNARMKTFTEAPVDRSTAN